MAEGEEAAISYEDLLMIHREGEALAARLIEPTVAFLADLRRNGKLSDRLIALIAAVSVANLVDEAMVKVGLPGGRAVEEVNRLIRGAAGE